MIKRLFFVAILFFSFPLFITGAIKIWTGGTSANWNTASNWSGGLPVTGDSIIIDANNYTSGNAPIVSSNSSFSPKNITIQNGGILTVDATISVTGNIAVATSSTLTTNDANSGVIYFNGISNLSGSGSFTFPNIVINNGCTLNQSGPASINIKGSWTNNGGFFVPNTNKVIFSGSVIQQLDGTLSSQIFYDFEVAKTSQSLRIGESVATLMVHDFTQTSYKFHDSALTAFYVSGNFTHTSGTFVPCNDIYIGGNIYDNYSGTSSDLNWGSSVTLNGITTQYIGGSHSINSFETLVINNESGAEIILQQPISIDTSLTLTNGIITTDGTHLLIIKDNATVTSGSANSFVNGPIKKIGDDPFVFPVGKIATTNVWARLEMVNDANFKNFNSFTEFTCTYYSVSAPYYNSTQHLSSGIKYASKKEYWELERTHDAGNDAQCNVRIYWEDTTYSGINKLSDLKLVHLSSQTNLYEDQGGTIAASGKTGSFTSSVPLNNFSPVTFGSGNGINPLAIELLSFSAKVNGGNNVELSWEVASETNNDFFTVERSVDGIAFNEIAKINGQGTSSSPHCYSTIDERPILGISYYRLKQTDFDGKIEKFKIVSVQVEDKNHEFIIFPNPLSIQDNLILKTNSETDEVSKVYILDESGSVLYSKNLILNKGYNQIPLKVNDCNLPSGVYSIVVMGEAEFHLDKLIVK